jgi:hypothetical protein
MAPSIKEQALQATGRRLPSLEALLCCREGPTKASYVGHVFDRAEKGGIEKTSKSISHLCLYLDLLNLDWSILITILLVQNSIHSPA